MLSAVDLVHDYQGMVDVEQSKMSRINFNTIFPSFIQVERSKDTKFKIMKDFYPIPQILNLNEKYLKTTLQVLHLYVLNSSHISEESEGCHFSCLQKSVFLKIYTTHFTTCDITTAIAQICMCHTAMKQKVGGELTAHTQVAMTIAPFLQ